MKGFTMEKLLKVHAGEIYLVRIRCKQCGDAALEIPLAALASASLVCPGCGRQLRKADVDKALSLIANGILSLQKHPEVELQFLLPAGD